MAIRYTKCHGEDRKALPGILMGISWFKTSMDVPSDVICVIHTNKYNDYHDMRYNAFENRCTKGCREVLVKFTTWSIQNLNTKSEGLLFLSLLKDKT
jgi:hypothetical protein